jgi:acyl-CoA dehydrogenase
LRDLVRRLAQDEIVPVAAGPDREQRFSQEIVERYSKLGLLRSAVPEAYGGCGLGGLELCIIAEELAAACAGVASSL